MTQLPSSAGDAAAGGSACDPERGAAVEFSEVRFSHAVRDAAEKTVKLANTAVETSRITLPVEAGARNRWLKLAVPARTHFSSGNCRCLTSISFRNATAAGTLLGR